MKVSNKIKDIALNWLGERYYEERDWSRDNENKDELVKAIDYLISLAEGDYDE